MKMLLSLKNRIASNQIDTIVPPPAAPVLTSPADDGENIAIGISFNWEDVIGADTYHIQISTSAVFLSVVEEDATLVASNYTLLADLDYETVYYWRVSATGASGTSEWSEVWSFTTVPDYKAELEGLAVAYWKMEENAGEDRIDATGNGHDLTDVSTTTALEASGVIDGCAFFDVAQVDSFVTADHDDFSATDDWFAMFWVNFKTKTSIQTLFNKRTATSGAGNQEYNLIMLGTSSDLISFNIWNNAGTAQTLSASALGAVNTGVWYHVLVQKNGTNIRIRINDTHENSATLTVTPFNGTSSFRVGGQLATPQFTMDGWIDEFMFGRGVPTAEAITWHYNAGAGQPLF